MCSFFKQDTKYRHGKVYKLFYKNFIFYEMYIIQKTNWFGEFYNIYETEYKKVYDDKVREMVNKGVVFENYK